MDEIIQPIKKVLVFILIIITIIPMMHGNKLNAKNIIEINSEVLLNEFIIRELRPDVSMEAYVQEIEEVVIEDDVDEPVETQTYYKQNICSTTSTFKSYMDYRTITNTNSIQYKLQQNAYSSNGYRIIEGRKLVAMASYELGTKLDIVLSSGETIQVMIGDIKAGTNCEHPDGSVIEFIVDTNTMDSNVRKMGSYNVIHNGYIQELYIVE